VTYGLRYLIVFFNCFGYAGNSRRSNAVADSSHGNKRGMVLPFEPYSITFDEIVYSVDMPQVSHFQSYKLAFGLYSQGFELQS
jgi:hypothetical protein